MSARVTVAALTMVAGRAGALLIGLAGLMILSRLLEPAEFGLFAVALAAFGLAQAVSEFGLLQFTVRQAAHLDPGTRALSTAIAFAASVVAGLAMAGLPHVLPDGWVDPRLAAALLPLAVALPLNSLMQQRQAVLHRELAFTRPALAETIAVAAEVALAVFLALAGYGLMSLAWGFLAGRATHALVFLLAAPLPRLVHPGLRRWREIMGFGGQLTGIRLLTRGASLALLYIVTGIAGAAATGVLNRAQRLYDLPGDTILNALRPVILPAFAEGLRNGMRPADLLAAKTERLAPLLWTAFGALILLADPLVAVLLGPGWGDVVPVVQLLALGGLAAPATLMSMKFFVAIDALGAYTRIQSAYLVLMLSGAAAMAFVSLPALAAAIGGANIFRALLFHLWYRRHLDLAGATVHPGLRAACVSVAALAGPTALVFGTALSPVPLLATSIALSIAVWLIAIRLTGSPLAADMGRVLRAVRP